MATTTMIRSGSFSFLFSIPSCFFFSFFLILVLLSLSSSSSSANALSAHSQQCLDLLDLKKGFIKFNKSDDFINYPQTATTSLPHWHTGTDCCEWEGVGCHKASGLVVSLDLSERYMGGNIMPSLFNLTSLQTLNLAYNSFNRSAVLLLDFEKLANLTHLNLSHSTFSPPFSTPYGQVPMGISRLTKLISLDLSTYWYHDLKLEKPDLGTLIRHLSNLKELYLDRVNISSSSTEWCQTISDSAPGLQALSLQSCSLSGPIDSSLSKLRNLSILRLDDNYLLSQVPDFFAKFSSLTELSLSDCGLNGLFPGSVFELLNLKTLDLSDNSNLTGFLPEFPFNSSLETLTISDTTFSGGLPNSLGNLKSLTFLNFADCNFSGPIPLSIWNLSELVYLDLSYNYLSGDLPPMPARSKISTLDLSSNYFTGQIPSTLGHAHHLTSLDLQDNLLTGSIPMSLFTHPILEELYLSDNKLSGQLQEFTNASSILQVVDLGDNNLHGKLPKSLVNLFALDHLDLSSNNFDGSVVGLELFGHLQNLSYLDLSGIDMSISDRIDGSSLLFPSLYALILQSCNLMAIPSFLKHKKNMVVLDLSNNRINGIIPKWIWSSRSTVNLSCNLFTHIERPLPDPQTMMGINNLDLHSNILQGPIPLLKARFLDYSNNYFTGSIPFNISAYLLDTYFFSLANNNLTGEVPTSICDTNLEILDLSNNSLSGSIHKCLLESLSNLQVLNLRRNQFRGILPGNINSSCSLVIINFFGNKLEGEIPKSLAKCEKLEFLDLGSNKLAGSFPYWLGNLPSLKVLVLRENRFYGYFECPPGASVGNRTFEVLQILDISSNNFTGNLPLDCFTRMKAMMIPQEGAGTIGFSYDEPSMQSCPLMYHCTSIKVYTQEPTYYEDLVTEVAKGYKREVPKIPATTSYIDVSNNRFEGTLPEVIGDLKSLNFLNMSLNAFKGHIPQVLGNLRDLESLDLSGNQLSGEIPNSLTSLTFLSFLNLSNNNLVGRIPQGNQFNTFPNASFEGNPGLCGFPLSRQCVNSTSMEPSTDLNNASPELDMEEIWIWMFRGLGFGVGFALAIFRRLLFTKLKIWYKRRFMNR